MRANSGQFGTEFSGSLEPIRDGGFWLLDLANKNWEGEKFHFPNFFIHLQKKKPENPVPKWSPGSAAFQ